MENGKVENKDRSAESNQILKKSIIVSGEEGTEFSCGQNITNINSDCMEHIFERLELNDLLNVADSSKQFYNAACQVYKRKYLNMNPIHDNGGYIRPGVDTNALERNPRLIITNPIILLKLLRNFGHFIRNLGVDFWYLNTKICDAIEIYLAIYCSDSLERFDFSCKGPKKPFENLQKPLKKLKALRLRTHLDQQQNFVQFINESNLPNLQYLYIKTLCDINPHEKIHHKNVEYLTVECIHMNTFPFSFENLKELNFFGNIEVNDAFCKYIGSMKHLKTMKLKSTYNRWSSDLLDKLLQDVPLNVEKIRFGLREENCRKMSIETITHFMKQSRNLRKMSFVLEIGISNRAAEVWLQELSLKLCEEWESYMMDPYKCYKWYKCYVIERKT